MKKYCIFRKRDAPKLPAWPEDMRTLYRSMDKARKLEGFASKEAAIAAIPEILREVCTVGEYTYL